MAGRGSGIGLGVSGGFGSHGGGGSATSTRAANIGQVYAPKGGSKATAMGVHHYLWILVALEIGILIFARAVVFKSYHAG